MKTYKTVMIQYAIRNRRLKALGYDNYADYLKSDDWKLTKEKWSSKMTENPKLWAQCRICERNDNLFLHHLRYGRIENIGFKNFIPVCNRCHNEIHKIAHSPKFNGGIKTATRRWARKYRSQNNLSKLTPNSFVPPELNWSKNSNR